jgi:hypothetical protein
MKGYCSNCFMDILDEWQDCNCFPHAPQFVQVDHDKVNRYIDMPESEPKEPHLTKWNETS